MGFQFQLTRLLFPLEPSREIKTLPFPTKARTEKKIILVRRNRWASAWRKNQMNARFPCQNVFFRFHPRPGCEASVFLSGRLFQYSPAGSGQWMVKFFFLLGSLLCYKGSVKRKKKEKLLHPYISIKTKKTTTTTTNKECNS